MGTILTFALPTEKQNRETNHSLIWLSLLNKPEEKMRALTEATCVVHEVTQLQLTPKM